MNLTCAPLPAVPSILTEDTAQPVTVSFTETMLPGNQPGQFIVTRLWVATDACGNSSQAEQLIRWTPNTFVECAILLPPPVECSTHGVVISSSVTDGVAPYTYVWAIDGDDYLLQSGQGTPQITIYIGFSPIDISLTVTDSYGCETVCTATMDCEDPLEGFAGNPTGTPAAETESIAIEVLQAEKPVDFESNLEKVSFWPNPVSETLHLSFTSASDREVSMRLINTLGQTVKSAAISGVTGRNEYDLDVADLTEGSYVIELKTEKEIYTRVILLLRNK
jgi:hypothetical protein